MENMKNSISVSTSKIYKYILFYKKEFIAGVAAVIGIIVVGVGYSFYMDSVQRRAHDSFVEAIKYFDSKVVTKDEEKDDLLDLDKYTFSSGEEKWNKVITVFQNGYEQNKSAGIAPMFLAYESEALLNLKKLPEAIIKLKGAVKLMAKSGIKTAYKVKLALMQIDSGNKEQALEGVSVLKTVSLEQRQPLQDMILYRLGEYYWYQKELDNAKNYWNRLILKYGKSLEEPSWWVSQAKPKLKLISAK
ncbi:tetratricopeptide repeat protein [Candidatus Dependentiae bacterium]